MSTLNSPSPKENNIFNTPQYKFLKTWKNFPLAQIHIIQARPFGQTIGDKLWCSWGIISWVHILEFILGACWPISFGWLKFSFLTLFVTTFGLDFYKSLGTCLLFVLINLGFMLRITSDKQLINWWKKELILWK
jgi:hypothetical protein